METEWYGLLGALERCGGLLAPKSPPNQPEEFAAIVPPHRRAHGSPPLTLRKKAEREIVPVVTAAEQ